ncbi:hypothetical protein [Sphingomonas desiccabilis]|uniref:hypothetical protein n=1 Tax=Sphingomonas desiccabilis TaxID=429134 RepID=UPI0013E9A5E7|nr:hypothetical protein [Sphingomonas desiccabilis]MBB3911016.1 hypothetical protein [Sphingomonas desiccabilis]
MPPTTTGSLLPPLDATGASPLEPTYTGGGDEGSGAPATVTTGGGQAAAVTTGLRSSRLVGRGVSWRATRFFGTIRLVMP